MYYAHGAYVHLTHMLPDLPMLLFVAFSIFHFPYVSFFHAYGDILHMVPCCFGSLSLSLHILIYLDQLPLALARLCARAAYCALWSLSARAGCCCAARYNLQPSPDVYHLVDVVPPDSPAFFSTVGIRMWCYMICGGAAAVQAPCRASAFPFTHHLPPSQHFAFFDFVPDGHACPDPQFLPQTPTFVLPRVIQMADYHLVYCIMVRVVCVTR